MRFPPENIAPERLFRLLLGTPRATQAIAFRFEGVEHGPLVVRALLSSELNAAFDAATGPCGFRADVASDHVVSMAVLLDGEQLFGTVDALRHLPDEEIAELSRQTWNALDVISPFYGRCDSQDWASVLLAGARHVSNQVAVSQMGGAYDIGGAARGRIIERPDRYFGRPLMELTDGQQMCFRSARRLHEEQQGG